MMSYTGFPSWFPAKFKESGITRDAGDATTTYKEHSGSVGGVVIEINKAV